MIIITSDWQGIKVWETEFCKEVDLPDLGSTLPHNSAQCIISVFGVQQVSKSQLLIMGDAFVDALSSICSDSNLQMGQPECIDKLTENVPNALLWIQAIVKLYIYNEDILNICTNLVQ